MADDLRQLARSFGRVSLDIVTAPARWRARQWLLFLARSPAATLLAYVEKRPIQAHVQGGVDSRASAIALFINAYLVTAALLAWAILVGWSRVQLGMHFVWNVMLGTAIGLFTGFVATRPATIVSEGYRRTRRTALTVVRSPPSTPLVVTAEKLSPSWK